jgi:hypothetical protein
MQLSKRIAVGALAGALFGCVLEVSRNLESGWARILLPAAAAGTLAMAVTWLIGRRTQEKG